MSLINDALRKAQKQRTGELPPLASMPAIGGESAVRIAKRARPAGFYTLLIRLGAGAAFLAVVIIGGVVLLRKKSLPAEARQSAGQTPGGQQPATVQPPSQQPTTAVPQTAAPAAAATTFVVPIAAPPAVQKTEDSEPRTAATRPQPATPAKAEVPAPKPVATAAPVPAKSEPVKPATPTKLEPKAIVFIESLRVVGIRASATDSKVLMNDRVYRIGNTIEHEMGIKLTGITANSLTFEDERGGSYTRTF